MGSVSVFVHPNWSIVALLALVCAARAQEIPAPPPAPAFSSVSPAFASEPELSVETLVARALQNSPQLPLARENLQAARERAGAARVFLNPTLQAVPRIAGSREAADSEIIVSQPLDVFGKRRAQASVFAAQVRGAESASLLAERSLVVQVKNAAAELFAAQEAENLGISQLEIARLFRDAAARRAQLGDVPQVQVQRADLELLRVENELSAARAQRLVSRAALNGIIGEAPETPLRVALPLSSDFGAVFPLAALENPSLAPNLAAPGANLPDPPLVGAASQIGADLVAQRAALLPDALQRPDILSAQSTIEARQAQVRAVARQRFPDIELQARRGSFFGQGASGTALRAVVTVPLFDFGTISREKKAAQAEVRAGQAQLALLRQQAATQVEQALIRLQHQRLTVETYRTGIVPQTLDLLRKTQIGYAQGASTYLEVLDAQRTLRAVQTEYLQALVGTRTGEAALESALGAAPPANLTGALLNPSGAPPPPGTAPIGTVPQGTIAPNSVEPLNPPAASFTTPIAPEGR